MNLRNLAISIFRISITVVLLLSTIIIAIWIAVRQPTWSREEPISGIGADPAILRKHVHFLSIDAESRNVNNPDKLNKAADYIKLDLLQSGAHVSEQTYTVDGVLCRNIIGRFGPNEGKLVVVGAHYDVCENFPGADDNASGVAGLLELARILSSHKLAAPVELVAYSTEEPPYFGSEQMGSAVHAKSLNQAGIQVKAMIALEMIGYYTEKQPYDNVLLKLVYPSSGNFVVAAGRWEDRDLARQVKRAFRGNSVVPCYSYSGPTAIGADLSDHRNYWMHGYPAVMVTDTAHMRNKNYHTAADTIETLDFAKMASVIDGVFASVVQLTF